MIPRCTLRLFTLLLALSFASCGTGAAVPVQPAGETVYLWVAAWQDAYVSCDFVIDCGDSGFNHGGDFTLVTAFNDNGIKNTYVQFELPTLPAGTQVHEAYLELYHDAMNEDGRTDDVSIPGVAVRGPWDSQTITYDNQPVMRPVSQEFSLRLNSLDWSGTGDISGIVQGHFDDPSSNHGFALYWDFNGIPPIEKGFNSKNNFRRPLTSSAPLMPANGGMTYGPRLLVRLTLPDGYTAADLVPPPMNPDDRFFNNGTFPDPPTMITATGTAWPVDWDVKAGGP